MKETVTEFFFATFIVITWLAGIVVAPTALAKIFSVIPFVAWYFLTEMIMRKMGLVP